MAQMLIQAMSDPAVAQQNGVTPEDIQQIQQVLSDPNAAVQAGEDPTMVQALVESYNAMSGQQGAQVAQEVGGAEAPMPAGEAAADIPEAGQQPVVQAAGTLVDMIPRLKSSNVLRQHSKEFQSMLSILGEMLFSLEVQAAKYRDQIGQGKYDNMVESLKNLYVEFGDVVAKMYMLR